MSSFRKRLATLLVPTLTAMFIGHAGLLSAQSSPDAWPFDEADVSGKPAQLPPAQATQGKSPVQLRIEALYRRDGRPLPEYMQNDASGGSASTPAPAQEPYVLPDKSAQPNQLPVRSQAPQLRLSRSAQPAASKGTLRQQLAEYYASQGKAMPQMQGAGASAGTGGAGPQWQSGEAVASSNASQPQPRLIDRFNPFRGFSQRENAATTTSSTAAPSSQPRQQGTAGRTQYSFAASPVSPPMRPPVPAVTATPAKSMMVIELGPSAPPSEIPRSVAVKPQPVAQQSARPLKNATLAPQPAAVAVATPTATPVPADQPTAAATPAPAPAPAPAPGAPVNPAAPAAPAQPVVVNPQQVPAVAVNRSEGAPFGAASEAEADKAAAAAPYTGLTLQEDQDGTATLEAAKVKAADANDTAGHASLPAEGANIRKQTVEQRPVPNRPISVTRTSPLVAPAPAPVPAPKPSLVAQKGTPAIRVTADAGAPKTFTAREPAAPIHKPEDTDAKMRRIGERVGQSGLKGFCPVALRDQRDLVDALVAYSSIYESKRYYFSSEEAKAVFDRNPAKYAPAGGGIDVVVRANSDQVVEGSLDYAAWYKDRLFLFSSPESLEAFSLNPLPYAQDLTGRSSSTGPSRAE